MPSSKGRPPIESRHNPRIKSLVQLHKHRVRVSSGLFLIEGAKELRAAIRAGVAIEEIFVQTDLAPPGLVEELIRGLNGKQHKLIPVGRDAFEKIAYRSTTGGIVAVAKAPACSLDDLPRVERPLFIVADSIEKPGNIGALFRTADAAGVTGLIASDLKTDLWNPNVIRASIGTVFAVPTACCTASDAACWLRDNNIAIITASPEGDRLYTDADMTGPCAIVMGSEDAGLSQEWLSAADASVRIPMRGICDSLNISVAATILIYEAVRQRI